MSLPFPSRICKRNKLIVGATDIFIMKFTLNMNNSSEIAEYIAHTELYQIASLCSQKSLGPRGGRGERLLLLVSPSLCRHLFTLQSHSRGLGNYTQQFVIWIKMRICSGGGGITFFPFLFTEASAKGEGLP